MSAIVGVSLVLFRRRRASNDAFRQNESYMLDAFDRALLNELQSNNLQTHAALAEKIALSPSAIRRRLQALRAAGLIAADVSLLDPARLPGLIEVQVLVTFERETPAIVAAFKKQMRADKQVVQCFSISGHFDFSLLVLASSPEAYEQWGQRVLMANPHIRRYDSFLVYSRVKFTTRLPLD